MSLPNTHRSSQYNEELEQLRAHVLEMGALIETQINTATETYSKGNADAVLTILENDRRVNEMEKSIDDECIHVIAKRQPTASDLRLIMAVGKIVTDLERMGDEIKKIAKSARHIETQELRSSLVSMKDIRHINKLATKQVINVLDAFARLDTELAEEIIEADYELDEEFRALVRQVVTYMMEDPRSISASLEVITMARAIERIGDHTTNIAEQVIYIAEGVDVRHTGSIDT